MARLASLTITVPANDRVRQPVSGSYFFSKLQDDPLLMQIDGQETIPIDTNTELRETKIWKVLEFINETGSDIQITFLYGDGTVRTNNIAISGVLDVDIQNASLPIANAAGDVLEVKLPSTDVSPDLVTVSTASVQIADNASTRTSITLKNTGAATVFLSGAPATTSDYPLRAGEEITLYTQDRVYGITASGSSDIAVLDSKHA